MTFISYPNPAYSGTAQPSLTLYEHEQMSAPLGPHAGLLSFTGAEPAFTNNTGREVIIPAGVKALIRSTYFENLTETRVPIDDNDTTQTRIDLVVLRLRRGLSAPDANDAFTIKPFVIKGIPSATPVAPNHVRNLSPDSGGFWDLPIRKVTAAPGSAALPAAASSHQGWWLTGSGYICLSSSRPPVEPGVLLREHNTGVTYIGTTSGEWLRQYTHIGPVHFGERVGWDNLAWSFVRAGNLVTMSMRLERTGGQVTAAVEFGDLPEELRPPETWWGTYASSTHDGNPTVAITTAGKIILAASGSKPINNGSILVSNMTWPTAP